MTTFGLLARRATGFFLQSPRPTGVLPRAAGDEEEEPTPNLLWLEREIIEMESELVRELNLLKLQSKAIAAIADMLAAATADANHASKLLLLSQTETESRRAARVKSLHLAYLTLLISSVSTPMEATSASSNFYLDMLNKCCRGAATA